MKLKTKVQAKRKAEFYAEQAQTMRRRTVADPTSPPPLPPAHNQDAARWWERFFEEKRARGDSDWKGDRGRYQKHIKPIVSVPMAMVTRDDCERLRDILDDKIRKGEMSWKTGWNIWSVFTTACKAAATSKRRALRVRAHNPECVNEFETAGVIV